PAPTGLADDRSAPPRRAPRPAPADGAGTAARTATARGAAPRRAARRRRRTAERAGHRPDPTTRTAPRRPSIRGPSTACSSVLLRVVSLAPSRPVPGRGRCSWDDTTE